MAGPGANMVEKLAALLLALVLAYYLGSLAISQFEDAAVLRVGQVVDARVKSKRSARGVILATVEYAGMGEGNQLVCVEELSLGYRRSSVEIGEQISVSVRPGPCARPVSRTAIQCPWVFVGSSLLMVAIALASVVSLVRRTFPSGQRQR
jgi:hypothetical protein